MIVIVCGGRTYGDRELVHATLYGLIREAKGELHLIQGGATGADALARDWVVTFHDRGSTLQEHGYQKHWKLTTKEYRARWRDTARVGAVIKQNKYGSYDAMAGSVRNALMLSDGKPDMVIAFPGGSGTADMVRQAEAARPPVPVRRVGW